MVIDGKGPRARQRLHDWVDERSLALDRRTAEIVRKRPELIQYALANLDRWEATQGPNPAFQEWRRILTTQPLDIVLALMTDEGEDAKRLRQSSPFTGILSPEERLEIFRRFEAI
ncbi:MAG TPA: hypothetical protein VFQ39_14170 [Longimicrobium sp.]|nr:hypothetical protein [Longimicrobium sp.]